MNLSKLLATRQTLLRQTQLANFAFAYATLERFAARIANANLRGPVRLRPADPDDESYWASQTAVAGSQAVIEEHFSDQDLLDFADAMTFAIDKDFDELEFELEDLSENYVAPLRKILEDAGVSLDVTDRQPDFAPDASES